MKTAATVLQEMMVKKALIPEYEHISKTGPQHQAMFEYRCVALGHAVTASARSKKEAKQEAARLMLRSLAAAGHDVPPPYGAAPFGGPGADPAAAGPAPRSYVALLKELCAEYRLPAAEYDLVADTGPAHLRHFTMEAQVLRHRRQATATTKKAARQRAAEMLYCYLRENLARVTRDFDEDDALARAHEKAMDRYTELRDDLCRKPDLGQRIADYHLGLVSHLDAAARQAALQALDTAAAAPEALEAAAAALRLSVSFEALPPLVLVALEPSAPPLALAGRDRPAAISAALRYLHTALRFPAPAPPMDCDTLLEI